MNEPIKLLRATTKSIGLNITTRAGDPVNLTGAQLLVTVSRDATGDIFKMEHEIVGDNNNIIHFFWDPKDQKECGQYTIDVRGNFGTNDIRRTNWHGPYGIELVEYAYQCSEAHIDGLDVEEIELEGILVAGYQDISGKADKVVGATPGNFPTLDEDGNLQDSGKCPTDFDPSGSASAAETAAKTYADGLIEALDATESQSAGTDGLALQITQVNGKITGISGSIAANTYDTYGSASAAETAAKTYADGLIEALGLTVASGKLCISWNE